MASKIGKHPLLIGDQDIDGIRTIVLKKNNPIISLKIFKFFNLIFIL